MLTMTEGEPSFHSKVLAASLDDAAGTLTKELVEKGRRYLTPGEKRDIARNIFQTLTNVIQEDEQMQEALLIVTQALILRTAYSN